ncbi:replication initiator protein A [Methylorubrum extorquens]
MSHSVRPPRPGARTGLRAPLFLLRYPFVALGRRTTPILFMGTEGGRAFFLTVGTTSPASSLPLHTDADILIAATTLLKDVLDDGQPLPNPITIMPLTLLRMLARPTGGSQRAQLEAALTRLTNTSVNTDIWPVGGTLFSLIERVERPDGPHGPYELYLPEFLLEEVRRARIFSFAPAALRLHGLERCLYGWARVYAGGKAFDSWRIELRDAHNRACAPPPYADPRRRGAALRQFKAALLQIAAADRLPEFRLTLEPRGKRLDLVLTRKTSVAGTSADMSPAPGFVIEASAVPPPDDLDDPCSRPCLDLD